MTVHAALPSLLLLLACSASQPLRAADTLREAAGSRLLFGCAVATVDLRDPALSQLITSQFSCITPEYELMPEKVVDERGAYTFEAGDQVVAFARAHQLPVYGHMLLWHFVTRAWLFADAAGKPLPRAAALANLKRYITQVVGHYRGAIKAWNVVNEAISDADGEYLKDTPALRAIGPDYIDQAFAFAQAADPDVALYYNDYNIEQPAKLAKTTRLITALRAAGRRIDAVGIQGHWLIDWPPTDVIASGIAGLARTGVQVMITELDVDPLPRSASGADLALQEHGSDPYPQGLPAELQRRLAQRYGDIVTTILKAPSVTMLSIWGTHDGRSWLNDFPVKGRTNHPLLFDRALMPKPAWNTVVAALKAGARP
jgi:endo-1,4-beta-xylanase